MIRVHRGATVPLVLLDAGANATLSLCRQYLAGERKFIFRSDIYGNREVKKTLKENQRLKCCFCERIVGEDGHVEHFRPKAAVRQHHGGSLSESGYYWLAYEWTNLMLSCADCNVRHKGNLFPLDDPAHRALSHNQDLTLETPIFLNPAEEDPESAICWEAEFPKSLNQNRRAAATIKALGLDSRDGLVETRRQHLVLVSRLWDALVVIRDGEQFAETLKWIADTEKQLDQLCEPRSKFSAMVRAFLADKRAKTKP